MTAKGVGMFAELEEIHRKPAVFEVYTAKDLWTEAHRSEQMLGFHLNESVDISSRKTAFIDQSCSWIVDRFDLGPGKSVCDFGCGPGLYTSRFAQSGAQVTGLDFSSRPLRYARDHADQNGLSINYVCTDYLGYDPDTRFDLVTMIMCDFCALSPAQRQSLLARFSQCLTEAGAILLDVYSMAAFDARDNATVLEKNQLGHFWRQEDYYCFVNTFKYEEEAVVLDKYSIFSETGRSETVYNWLQYFSPDSLGQEIAAAGLRVRDLYKDVSGQPYSETHPEFAIVATK